MEWLQAADVHGIIDLTPGIRSLQVHFDSRVIALERLLDLVVGAEAKLPPIDDMEVATRIVRLPLSWDDEATQLAIRKYMQGVRKDAPWCPSNIEFIRRINGLTSIDEVREIVFTASYLVLGLGDVYLGAPVATPVDPRHRLVEVTRTAPEYRLVALPDGRPGLERLKLGVAIEVEVWSMPTEHLGSFVAAIPPPLGIGTVRLADGRHAKGFLCESVAAGDAPDISAHGGWRAYLASLCR